MNVRWKSDDDDKWLRDFLEREWGGTTMIVHDAEVAMLALPALIAGDREGIAVIEDSDPAELVLLHAFEPGTGVGTALLAAVAESLRARGIKTLRVTTTNDNLDALRFYQRRGFRLHALRPKAVEVARRRKPTIPLIGRYNIPITDLLDLQLAL